MAIPMQTANPPYNTRQPNTNMIHADIGIALLPYPCSDVVGRFHKK